MSAEIATRAADAADTLANARAAISVEVYDLISSHAPDMSTLRALSLANSATFGGSRRHYLAKVVFTQSKMMEYGTFRKEMHAINTTFIQDLRSVQALTFDFPGLGRDQLEALCLFMVTHRACPKELTIRGVVNIDKDDIPRAELFDTMQKRFSQVKAVHFVTTPSGVPMSVFWLGLLPAGLRMVEFSLTYDFPAATRPRGTVRALELLQHYVPDTDSHSAAGWGTANWGNQANSVVDHWHPEWDASPTCPIEFPAKILCLRYDSADTMLKTIGSWTARGMTWRLTRLFIERLVWNPESSIFRNFLMMSAPSLRELAIADITYAYVTQI